MQERDAAQPAGNNLCGYFTVATQHKGVVQSTDRFASRLHLVAMQHDRWGRAHLREWRVERPRECCFLQIVLDAAARTCIRRLSSSIAVGAAVPADVPECWTNRRAGHPDR